MADLTDFHDVRFPERVAFGATGGPERRTEIVLLSSGFEARNARLARSRRRFDAGTGVRSLADLHEIVAFFEARRGSLHGFRFRDPFDWKSCSPDLAPSPIDQAIGTGDGTNRDFPLAKHYGEGADAYERRIAKPVGETVRVAVDGTEVTAGEDFAIDAATGIVGFAEGHAPGEGQVVTAGFEFDVPVRFDTDQLSVSVTAFKAGQIPTIPLIEILT